MLEEVIKAGGGSYLIFGVVAALAFYAIRGLFGLQTRRGQHRREFLELWSDGRPRDALWMQVAVRHLYGSHLPSPVIQLALARPDSSQALSDLSELWDLLVYDGSTRKVRWRRASHSTMARRKLLRVGLLLAYLVCALFAVFCGYVSARFGPYTLNGWVYGFCGAVVGFMAYICITKEDSVAVAVRVGDAWVNRINRAAIRSRKRVGVKASN
ncbi:hypothetical protein LVB77_03690 [Lysobacter sp. 5GHs7-4]|uniref:hypothetical protein n=1 Tax=Lysobacter sp. 5GHs7-4 TaxID=2904253 RepID=UPI001E46FE94|nr:hypothetical protein [Lysobacter sp. 5GHs7-4]UHQ23825.1 hypothetical protein LVB77_03690 [Lysobacter sp. 5GHs7-4]